jgi:hypothetical protein
MSPEQILGDKLDFRSDIFSLGIVLYQMVTGQKPFVEDDSHTVMQKIRLDRYLSPRKLNPQVPRRLDLIMSRCMEKLPQHRYPSTQALIDELIEFLAARVAINHSAQLVMFLREIGVVSDSEADEILETGGSRSTRRRDYDRTMLRHVSLAMGAVFACIVASGSGIQALAHKNQRLEAELPARELDQNDAGSLEVVVDPWAEVYADGKLLAVTPTAQRFRLARGRHYLRFVHPLLEPETREVVIARGQVTRLEVQLHERAAARR